MIPAAVRLILRSDRPRACPTFLGSSHRTRQAGESTPSRGHLEKPNAGFHRLIMVKVPDGEGFRVYISSPPRSERGCVSMGRARQSPQAAPDRQTELALSRAREADRIEPRADSVRYDPRQGLIVVRLHGGWVFGFPAERVRGLEDATAGQRSNIRISPSGDGLHWEDLDVDVSLRASSPEPSISGSGRHDSWVRSGAKPRPAPHGRTD